MTDPVVFSAAWFAQHQRPLLALLRTPVIGRELRDALAIRRHDVGWDRRIVWLAPHAYVVANPDGTFTMDVRTHTKYAKRLRAEFDALWRAAHAWDRFVANPLVPALNLGFDTLTRYPNANGDAGATTFDGGVSRDTVAAGEAWSVIRAGNGTSGSSAEVNAQVVFFVGGSTTNQWSSMVRVEWLFDTQAVGTSSDVSSAVFSLFGTSKLDPVSNAPTLAIVDAHPASNTGHTLSDFQNMGSTAQTVSGSLPYASMTTGSYVDIAIQPAKITRGGITAFGGREGTYDVGGATPTWSTSQTAWYCDWADQTGLTSDPRLVLTVIAAVGFPYPHLRAGSGVSTSQAYISRASTRGKLTPGVAR